ncbi:15066_t:CDS:1, partial [Acaulospora colombiana]
GFGVKVKLKFTLFMKNEVISCNSYAIFVLSNEAQESVNRPHQHFIMSNEHQQAWEQGQRQQKRTK